MVKSSGLISSIVSSIDGTVIVNDETFCGIVTVLVRGL